MFKLTNLLLILLALPAFGQKPLAPDVAIRVDATVEAEIKRQELVGVSIGILQDGEIVYTNGYGYSDRDKKTPMTIKSIVNWASNSKPVVAVLAMQLVEKKLLDLDKDIREYVPEFPKKEHVITTRHLLTHQSGIPHYSNGVIVRTTRKYTEKLPHLDPVNALDVFNLSPLIFKPGDKTEYSSYAFILLSAVIQKAGKEPYDSQIKTRIVKPLEMKSFQLDMTTAGQPEWAIGYAKDKSGKVVEAKEEAHYWKHGAGGYKSDIVDFARFAQGLMTRKLMTEATEKLMWTPQTISDGKLSGWGLGVSVDEKSTKVSHGGKQDETTTRLVIYPKGRHGIVVMTNCGFGDPSAISTVIYKALK